MSERDEMRTLETRLQQAWSAEDGRAVAADWKSGVMAEVRAEAARRCASVEHTPERIVRYGFLTAAAAAILAFSFTVLRTDTLDPAMAIARLIAGSPSGLIELALVL